MIISLPSLIATVLMSCFLVSCGGSDPDPFTKSDPNASGERRYFLEKADAGLTWKTRAEEIVRQAKVGGTYEKNAFKIQQAYARVDTSLQVWANAVAADAKLGRPLIENEQMHQKIESSLAELSDAAGVPPGRGWKRDLVVVLLKSFFPPAAPLVEQVNLAFAKAESARLRTRFLTAHQLVPATELQVATGS
ncbi:MAG: hypothetical protein ACJAVK_001123 [Akkermansiaceae bacterium]|jgi:hypothetical protein